MPKRGNPFEELERLIEQMEENFEEAARWWEREPSGIGAETGTNSVRVDLEDREDELVLTAELPGYDTDEMDVRVSDRTLRLDADREGPSEEESDGEFVRRERRRRPVSRTVSLPTAVDADGIVASYRNGVLRVRMPKAEPAGEGRRIEIE